MRKEHTSNAGGEMKMNAKRPSASARRPRGTAPVFLAALALGGLAAGRAEALTPEYEAGVFLGAHFWNPQNGLGRVNRMDDTSLQHSPSFGLRVGLGLHPHFFLEPEIALAPTETLSQRGDFDCTTLAPGQPCYRASYMTFGYRLSAVVPILTGRVRPFVLVGGGGLTGSSSNPNVVIADTVGEFHVGGGLKVDAGENWGFRLDGRALMMSGLLPAGASEGSDPKIVANGELLFSVYGRFGELKKPPKKPDPSAPVAPPAEQPVPASADQDHDGVADASDKCPLHPGAKEWEGCPMAPGPETRVPVAPAPAAAAAGDADKDGVPDSVDRCPMHPETRNGYQDDDGCPDGAPPPAAIAQHFGRAEGVSFEASSADLTQGSYAALDRLVAMLRTNPTVKIEVAGYTDTSGDATANRELSQKRADAVKAYLVKMGVPADRIFAVGYGPDNPVADNATPEGREKNRRVEFHFLN